MIPQNATEKTNQPISPKPSVSLLCVMYSLRVYSSLCVYSCSSYSFIGVLMHSVNEYAHSVRIQWIGVIHIQWIGIIHIQWMGIIHIQWMTSTLLSYLSTDESFVHHNEIVYHYELDCNVERTNLQSSYNRQPDLLHSKKQLEYR